MESVTRATQQNTVPPNTPRALQLRGTAGHGSCEQGEMTRGTWAPVSHEPPNAMDAGTSSLAAVEGSEDLGIGGCHDQSFQVLRRRNTNDSARSIWRSSVRWRSRGEASSGPPVPGVYRHREGTGGK